MKQLLLVLFSIFMYCDYKAWTSFKCKYIITYRAKLLTEICEFPEFDQLV
jgi:hypothetical protein